ncbi:DciA family protein [Thiomicrospira sp. R3]|uniref:DciA family protein n=1 Tax=Thiomicrospira sp. R3 TaxID=3035472 RepID=UPI00259B8A5D|nr:DciA family protein [Thiomicrospira sp. R3]WFE67826.1 DciA family protein [Thiomicrospira sp. R3]
MMKHSLEQPGLVKLFQQAQLYQALHELAQAELPANLAEHLVGVSIDQQSLICLVNNPAWASKLRFFEQNLLGCFQRNLPHLQLNQVQFKIMLDFQQANQVKRPANRPDPQSAQQMREMSKHLPDKLAQALTKLSQRALEGSD